MVKPSYVGAPLELKPFRALTLEPHLIGNPASAKAFARPYRDVADRLSRWQAAGRLSQDADAALYLHEYAADGLTVRGLVGALDVSRRAARPQDRVVFPHEGIHPAQADDLAERMEEMELNPAPILLVHRATPALRDLLAATRAHSPDLDFLDRSGQQHRIWRVSDTGMLDAVAEGLAPGRALIADGHHRYAAYLRLQQRRPGGAHDLGLAMLVDHADTPLHLGAIHRVLGGVRLDDLTKAAARAGCRVTAVEAGVAALGPGVLVATDGEDWASIELLDDGTGRTAVERLHADVVTALESAPERIAYHHAVPGALAHAEPGRAVTVLLPAPDVDEILRTAAEGRLLPEKATSFQPKPSLGVLMRSLRDG